MKNSKNIKDNSFVPFLKSDRYVYQRKFPPVKNYRNFCDSISFSRGIHFLSNGNVNQQYQLYLHDFPGISGDLIQAKKELKIFYSELTAHLTDIVNDEENAAIIYASIYDLLVSMHANLNARGPESFLAVQAVNATADYIKNLRKDKPANVAGKALKPAPRIVHENQVYYILHYDHLSQTIKKQIMDLIKLRHIWTKKVYREIDALFISLFKNGRLKHYQYSGEKADIIEIALLLHPYIKQFGGRPITLQKFASELGMLLGVKLSKIDNYKHIIRSRTTSNRPGLFIKQNEQEIRKFAEKGS